MKGWYACVRSWNYVDFAPLNLLAKQYTVPGPFDAIFCRNVMIYFDQNTQQEILRRLCSAP